MDGSTSAATPGVCAPVAEAAEGPADVTLPTPGGRLFITDGGLETALIFHQGIELTDFAAFPLLYDEEGRTALRAWFEPFVELARRRNAGLVLDTVTWRASLDWGKRLGYDAVALDRVNADAVRFCRELAAGGDVVVNGVVGPRGDGYVVGETMGADAAASYHAAQVDRLAREGVDMVTALTLTYADEAVGIVDAARAAGVPVAISFTVETDGRLPSGQALGDAIAEVDAKTGRGAIYFMVNCAHPTHLDGAIEEREAWTERLAGIRANASTKSHAELDAADELDDGDPDDLGRRYALLRDRLPSLSVVGGCCGTDLRHVEAVSAAWPS